VGWSSKLGPWSRLENHAVVGEDVTVRPEVRAGLGLIAGHRVREATWLQPHGHAPKACLELGVGTACCSVALLWVSRLPATSYLPYQAE